MKLTPSNFLTHIKNLVTGGGTLSDGTTPHMDAGYLKDSHLASAQVAAAASTTAIGTFTFIVPRDYDEATDTLIVEAVAKMGGATDTPTVTLAPTADGTAMTAATGSSLTTAALSSTVTKYTIDLSGNSLVRDQVVTLVFTSGAHTTDALDFQALRLTYRSTLVSYSETDSSGNALR